MINSISSHALLALARKNKYH